MNSFDLSDFLKSRQSGLGGSDIATLFGINPYSTKLELYLHKRGEIEPTADTRLTRTGRAMEQVIAVMVADALGAYRKNNRNEYDRVLREAAKAINIMLGESK